MNHNTKSRLAITMGDPAGVGPEIIAGCWPDARIHAAAKLFVIGHAETMRRAVALRKARTEVKPCSTVEEALSYATGTEVLPCLAAGPHDLSGLARNQATSLSGEVAYQCVLLGTDLAISKQIDGIVTAPLAKSALHMAGHHYPGHTELLAERCGITDFAMMLYLPKEIVPLCPYGLGVVHVTLHMAMREVFAQLTEDHIVEKCHLAHRALAAFGAKPPRIAVAAHNPHGGEDGLFGDEELRVIGPAVERAKSQGLTVTGPLPTDTLMVRAHQGEFDAVVAMYHDQGHIALKLLGMHGAVNVTLGLPIVRTSVAHGTAYDIAWQGTAESSGMVSAILTAAKKKVSGTVSDVFGLPLRPDGDTEGVKTVPD